MHSVYCTVLFIVFSTATSSQNTMVKNIGKISFFEKTWTHSFDLSLDSYINNAILLQNITIELVQACKDTPDDVKCQYFKNNIERNAAMAQKDIDLLLHHRTKRFWAGMRNFATGFLKQALITVGIIGVTEAINKNELDEIKEQLRVQKETIVSMHELDNLRNNHSVSTNNEMHVLFDRVKNMTLSNQNKDTLNNLIDAAKDALSEHYQETTKFMRILNNDLRNYFFTIIDMDTFLTSIREIELLLNPNARLPTLNPYKLLDVSSLGYTNNLTHVSLHLKMPIISNTSHNLYEFTPIPVKQNGKLQILKMTSRMYFWDKNNIIKVLRPHIFHQCIQIENNMFCNSLLYESLDPLDECMASILFNKPIEQCIFRKIEYRNYYIRLSPHSVYCYIVKPIQFRIICNGQEKIHKLNTSTEIDFSNQCDVHKVLNELRYNNKTKSLHEISKPIQLPNFSIFDSSKNDWSDDVVFFNESNATLTKILSEFDKINATIHTPISISLLDKIFNIPKKIIAYVHNIFFLILSNTFLFVLFYFTILFTIVHVFLKFTKKLFSFQE